MRRSDRLEQRRQEATIRQVKREKRGDKGQITKLKTAGHGHCKEVIRLRKRVSLKE